ncbi:MAG: polysaccharide biosynthesis protein, partial [Stenotrophomonas maltophilia]
MAGLGSVLLRALKVVHAMGVRGFIARLRSASVVRTRASEPFDTPALPVPIPLEQLRLSVGVMAHVFYPDLINEFATTLSRMPLRFTLLVSVMDAAAEAQAREAFGRLPNVQTLLVRQVQNRGRDIAPLLVTFREEIKALDLVCHIHTKKSLYTGSEQQTWRHYLLDSLLGSRERIAWILGTFQADPQLGLVYPESYDGVPLWAHTWLSNGPACDALAQKLGIALDAQRYIDFPAGSMFWARVDALRPLYDLNLPLDAF